MKHSYCTYKYIHKFGCKQMIVYKGQIYRYVCKEYYKQLQKSNESFSMKGNRNKYVYIRIYFYFYTLIVSILWTNKGICFYRTKQYRLQPKSKINRSNNCKYVYNN